MLPRFHIDSTLSLNACIPLPQALAHHAHRVLRLDAPDEIVLFNGQGGQWRSRLQRHGKNLFAQLLEFTDPTPEPALQVTLVQALPAADKMDWIVQKCVELGVARILPVATRRSVLRLDAQRIARRLTHWQNVAIAACEQSGRNYVPQVETVLDLAHYLAQPQPADALHLALIPKGVLRLREMPAPQSNDYNALVLLIGPEGGFDDSELSAITHAGFTNLRFGTRILRTETAGMAALAAIMALWGDI